jgi:F0F1-type ATP synthase membrane subunit b/b'
MRAFIIMIWLMIPIGMAYHCFSPEGAASRRQDAVSKRWDEARETVQAASEAGGKDETERLLTEARIQYEEAIKMLPKSKENHIHRNQMALENALVMLKQGLVEESLQEIEGLMEAIRAGDWPESYEDNFRAVVAAGTYQAAVEMRMRGYNREEWASVADDARQQYCMLAGKYEAMDSASSRVLKRNLEATLRLVRMDLAFLEGAPLPKPPGQTRMKRTGESDIEGFIKSRSEPGH